MRKLLISICLAIVFHGIWAGSPTLPMGAEIGANLAGPRNTRTSRQGGSLANNPDRPDDAMGLSCAEPTPDVVPNCKEIERQILASTVRIEWDLWAADDDGDGYSRAAKIGHATVKEGRYLVTHNHGGIAQAVLQNNKWNRISVFTANGVPRLVNGPLSTVTIVAEDTETLVLDFGAYGGRGLISMFGLSSAEFKAWDSLPLQPGIEVAQVIWDGERASIDWVTVDAIVVDNGTPQLELNSTVAMGTSGGGVFWNGYHIANTWSQRTTLNAKDGTVLRHYSVAALNAPLIAAGLCGGSAPTASAQPPDSLFC